MPLGHSHVSLIHGYAEGSPPDALNTQFFAVLALEFRNTEAHYDWQLTSIMLSRDNWLGVLELRSKRAATIAKVKSQDSVKEV